MINVLILDPQYQCVQKIKLTPQKLEDRYIDYGVSFAGPGEQMEPIPVSFFFFKNENTQKFCRYHIPKPGSKDIQSILHPDTLSITKHQWNDDI